MTYNKNFLRHQYLEKCKTSIKLEQNQQNIYKKLQILPEYLIAQKIGLYYAKDYEISLLPIINDAWGKNKLCYLPIIDESTKVLNFGLYTPTTTLIMGKYNIYTPLTIEQQSAQDLDIIFVPLIVFSTNGTRLGHGKGYYDATINSCLTKKPTLIGVAYSWQQIKDLPQDPWDICLNIIVTETHIYRTTINEQT